jgi:hypothetical protein
MADDLILKHPAWNKSEVARRIELDLPKTNPSFAADFHTIRKHIHV